MQAEMDAATKKHANAAATTEYSTSLFATVSPFTTTTTRDQPSGTYPPQQGTVAASQVTPAAAQTGFSINTPWQQQRQMPPQRPHPISIPTPKTVSPKPPVTGVVVVATAVQPPQQARTKPTLNRLLPHLLQLPSIRKNHCPSPTP